MRFLPGTSTDSTISHGPFFADRRVQQESRCSKVKRFLWNSEQRTVCERTGKNWIILLVVYGVFMTILIGMFYLSLYITMVFIRKFHSNSPQITRFEVMENAGPGLSAVPNLIDKVKLPLIWYSAKNGITADYYTKYLNEYFEAYVKAKSNSKFVVCDKEHPKPANKLCLFDVSSMGPCGAANYGYGETSPCFYLKLNKLPGWTPEYYDKGDLPKDMPEELQKVIGSHSGSQYIWVYCEGVAPHDQQHVGNMTYYPQQAFYGGFYPYEGDKDFLPPLVAVQAEKHDNRYLVSIHCSVWAKNLKQRGPLGRPSGARVNFYLELL